MTIPLTPADLEHIKNLVRTVVHDYWWYEGNYEVYEQAMIVAEILGMKINNRGDDEAEDE